MSAFRYSSGLLGAPPADMYLNVQCKTSWSPLGHQVANLAPSLLKPMARGRVSLVSADPAIYPRVEFNFTGHELDLKRFMQGFRLCIDILSHDAVQAMTRLAFRSNSATGSASSTASRRPTGSRARRSRRSSTWRRCLRRRSLPRSPTGASISRHWRGRCRAGRLHSRQCRRHVPPGRHLPHGRIRRSRRRDRSGRPRSRRRRFARHRCLDHADDTARQHQYSDHHGGGKTCRRDAPRNPGRLIRPATPGAFAIKRRTNRRSTEWRSRASNKFCASTCCRSTSSSRHRAPPAVSMPAGACSQPCSWRHPLPFLPLLLAAGAFGMLSRNSETDRLTAPPQSQRQWRHPGRESRAGYHRCFLRRQSKDFNELQITPPRRVY